MSSSNGTVVPLYIQVSDQQALVGSVVSASPSQTAMVLNCPPGTDGSDCGYYNLSVTVGPWAAATPPPNLPATGVYDMYMAMDSGSEPDADGNEGFTISIHCEVTSRTIPSVCTSINVGGNNDGTPTATFSNPGTSDDYAFSLAPITFTAGIEKLSAAASATNGPSSTGGSMTAITGSRTTSGSVSATGSSTSSGAAASQTGAASVYGVNMGTMGLLALAVAWFTR
ncbi:hypothetical protein B9Z65_1446 [Elsinoe australis]|uniref:Uncharacterized protein n=1 Tax=Elsinoe australis TaxID=40998 RepID=A0A2P7YFW7_9PEZI|nr:hypothetical protein B9Z65_1446 [Elsinoe australis]